MRTYHFTCRGKNGQTCEGELTALTRADALRELTVQGNVPLSVTEVSPKASGPYNLVSAVKWGVLALAVVGCILFVTQFWGSSSQKSVSKKRRIEISQNSVKKSILPKTKQDISVSEEPLQRVVNVATTNQLRPEKKSLSVEDVIAKNSSTNQTERVRPSPAFNMAAESVMSMLLAGSPGTPGPPIPHIPNVEKRFLDSLTNNIILYDTDSEEMAKHKEAVALLKLEFAEYMKQGYTASNIIAAIQEQRVENVKLRRELREQMMELYNAGQFEEAEKYCDEANDYLTQQGLPLISLPRPK